MFCLQILSSFQCIIIIITKCTSFFPSLLWVQKAANLSLGVRKARHLYQGQNGSRPACCKGAGEGWASLPTESRKGLRKEAALESGGDLGDPRETLGIRKQRQWGATGANVQTEGHKGHNAFMSPLGTAAIASPLASLLALSSHSLSLPHCSRMVILKQKSGLKLGLPGRALA